MKITLGTSTLVDGQERYAASTGKAVGPEGLILSLAPGVEIHEYIGADRIAGEHIKCDHGTLSFKATRIFASPAAALAYIRGGFLAEASEGALKFDNDTVFENAVVTSRSVALVGCSVAISYSIEG